MANNYINVYKDNPTEGGVDGVVVSDGDSSSPPDEPEPVEPVEPEEPIDFFNEAKEKDHIFVVEIYDISLRTGMLYVCNTDRDIVFEGNKYVPIPLEREDISLSVDDIDNEMKLTMADATVEQLQYIIAGFDFRGCNVRVRQILYPESLNDNSIFREAFYGYIDNPAYENGEFSCTLRSRIPKVTVPRRTFQSTCNCKFGDAICQADIAAEVKVKVE